MRQAEAIDVRDDIALHGLDAVSERLGVHIREVFHWGAGSWPVPAWVVVDDHGVCVVSDAGGDRV